MNWQKKSHTFSHFFPPTLTISSFHLFLHPLLGLCLSQLHQPRPASSVEDRSLRNISSEGTAVRISPRTTFQTRSFLRNFRTNVWWKIQLWGVLHQPHAASIGKLLQPLSWVKENVARTNWLYDGRWRHILYYAILQKTTLATSSNNQLSSWTNRSYDIIFCNVWRHTTLPAQLYNNTRSCNLSQ